MKSLQQLTHGAKAFRKRYFDEAFLLSKPMGMLTQKPKVAMIACSDSRVDPAILLATEPGDLFVIRNVANLVPLFNENHANISTGAALEFAVCKLKVSDIVICGHSHCAGIAAVMKQDEDSLQTNDSFVNSWVRIAVNAKSRVKAKHPHLDGENQLRHCEQESVLVGLENLMSFPWVYDSVRDEDLRLHGWYLDLATGNLSGWDPGTNCFHCLNESTNQDNR